MLGDFTKRTISAKTANDQAMLAALEDSVPGVASALAAGMFVIAVPYFPGTPLEGASLAAPSLADPSVAAALGVVV